MKRIISLLPAATEIICALGLEENLVGRSHECDFPASIQYLPICSDAKFTSTGSSKEIDQQVKEILSDSLSIYKIDKALIQELKPDIIITQAQCDVCAVSLKDVEEALADFIGHQTQIISLEPKVLNDVFDDIRKIAAATDTMAVAETLIEDLEERKDIVKHKLKFFNDKPKVACIEWLEPVMVSGNWIPELVQIAGGTSLLAQNGQHSPFVSWEEIAEANPDIIIIMPCGFSISRTMQEIGVLLSLPQWKDLQAVKNNKIYIADGNHYFNRSGPRLVDSIEILAEIITPKYFNFGYEGHAWVKFDVA
ncbi:cobalamin-binding protein [Pedobacter glucosidilyticus]|uniref:cobalamin-binding protein n=1 Tax=Pedobacter glucosidilyticus TaxID=1122941 RepID=UPI00041099E0|nr:cobalamin-binding protein [Pedobacter glucosidilyticus]